MQTIILIEKKNWQEGVHGSQAIGCYVHQVFQKFQSRKLLAEVSALQFQRNLEILSKSIHKEFNAITCIQQKPIFSPGEGLGRGQRKCSPTPYHEQSRFESEAIMLELKFLSKGGLRGRRKKYSPHKLFYHFIVKEIIFHRMRSSNFNFYGR